MKKGIRILTAALFLICAVTLTLVGTAENAVPDVFQITQESEHAFSLFSGAVTVAAETERDSERVATTNDDLQQRSLRLFGVVPIKTVTVKRTSAPAVRLCGTPFGIKAYTDGVLVVGLCAVDTHDGNENPAREAGIRVGDVVLSVDGCAVTTNEQLSACIAGGNGKAQVLSVRRDGVEFPATVRAVYSASESTFKAGMWVRDSAAGIGTLTFYDLETGTLAGLGHAICDVDTGDAIPISGGELVPAYIFGIDKGEEGKAGELRGSFTSGTLGELYKNVETGIYGKGTAPPAGETVTVAMKQEVKEGAVSILACVEGNEPTWYEAQITKIRYNDGAPTRNMVVKITDGRLLQKTGGIVQGMSGSPLMQDGRLVGAVTHVFLNDPTEGYAIFAENMWKTAVATAENAA